jgi:signal transduction histidine kinase
MSLAVRLLLALGAVALFVTALVGWSARDVSRREVERGFEQRIDAAIGGARGELVWEASTLAELLAPQCKHDTFVDRAVLDLERLRGDVVRFAAERGIAVQQLVRSQQKALRVDELLLATTGGHILGADDLALVGTRRTALGALLRQPGTGPRLTWERGEASLQAHCVRTSGEQGVGLVTARRVAPILARVGGAYGVRLGLADGTRLDPSGELLVRHLRIPEIPGLEVVATISRQPLFEALAQIDVSILLSGAIAVLLSVALAAFVARGLSQPIVELAEQTSAVVSGSPHPVKARGSRELRQLANTFNHAIEELASMRRRLARTERIAARREVARQVAHEIKNPLAPIRAAVETLRRLRDRGSPQFDEYFDEATKTVLAEVHRIKTIVGEFAKFARMPPPEFVRVDLEAIAHGVVKLHDAADAGSGPEVRLLAEPLPPIMADQDQLVQVLTNLIQNGIEAASGVQERPLVTVTLRRGSGREVVVAVRDNGPGIDSSVRERLFEPYVTTKPEGTGLGLAIVQSIVHEHGGEIRCADAAGVGALFELVLPVDGPPLLEKAPAITTG